MNRATFFGGGLNSRSSYWTNRNWANLFCRTGYIKSNKDTVIVNNNPTFNYGAVVNLAVGEYNTGAVVTRSLLDFDLSSVSDTHVLKNVSLNLRLGGDLADNTRKIQVFRMKRSWVEGNKNGAAPANGATWNTHDGTSNWTAAGGFHADDCEQVPIGELEIAHDQAINTWLTIPLNVTLKGELTLGYGLMLKNETETDDGHLFKSRSNAGLEPYIYFEIDPVLINGIVTPALTKSASNPMLSGRFGTVVYVASNNYQLYYSDGTNVCRASSIDGLAWTDDVVNNPVMAPSVVGRLIDVVNVWIENGTYYMLYRSSEWYASNTYNSIGLATSADGITWTKNAGNPVFRYSDIAWGRNQVDPVGIIKVGNTYYMWINEVSQVPRESGLITSTDLVNWTANANNPIFTNGRYCPTIIKYKTHYYLFMPYTPTGVVTSANPIKNRIELYRDVNPTFLVGEREYLGNILLGGANGQWDDIYLDTPTILTGGITRDTFPIGTDRDGRLYMYYCASNDALITWNHGLAIGHLEMLEKLTAITEPNAGE